MSRPNGGGGPRRVVSMSRRLVAGGLVLLLLGAALSAAGASVAGAAHAQLRSGPGGSGAVVLNVTATDAPAFVPHGLSAVEGSTVTFVVNNTGAFPHTFSLLGVANETIPANSTPSELDALFAMNGTSVNLTVAPGRRPTPRSPSPRTGSAARSSSCRSSPTSSRPGWRGS